MEAVLRAYAAGSPEEQARGEWTAEVETFDGARRIALSVGGIEPGAADEQGEDDWFVDDEGPCVASWYFPGVEPWELAEFVSNPPRGRVSEARRERYVAQSLAYMALRAPDNEKGVEACLSEPQPLCTTRRFRSVVDRNAAPPVRRCRIRQME